MDYCLMILFLKGCFQLEYSLPRKYYSPYRRLRHQQINLLIVLFCPREVQSDANFHLQYLGFDYTIHHNYSSLPIRHCIPHARHCHDPEAKIPLVQLDPPVAISEPCSSEVFFLIAHTETVKLAEKSSEVEGTTLISLLTPSNE